MAITSEAANWLNPINERVATCNQGELWCDQYSAPPPMSDFIDGLNENAGVIGFAAGAATVRNLSEVRGEIANLKRTMDEMAEKDNQRRIQLENAKETIYGFVSDLKKCVNISNPVEKHLAIKKIYQSYLSSGIDSKTFTSFDEKTYLGDFKASLKREFDSSYSVLPQEYRDAITKLESYSVLNNLVQEYLKILTEIESALGNPANNKTNSIHIPLWYKIMNNGFGSKTILLLSFIAGVFIFIKMVEYASDLQSDLKKWFLFLISLLIPFVVTAVVRQIMNSYCHSVFSKINFVQNKQNDYSDLRRTKSKIEALFENIPNIDKNTIDFIISDSNSLSSKMNYAEELVQYQYSLVKAIDLDPSQYELLR